MFVKSSSRRVLGSLRRRTLRSSSLSLPSPSVSISLKKRLPDDESRGRELGSRTKPQDGREGEGSSGCRVTTRQRTFVFGVSKEILHGAQPTSVRFELRGREVVVRLLQFGDAQLLHVETFETGLGHPPGERFLRRLKFLNRSLGVEAREEEEALVDRRSYRAAHRERLHLTVPVA